MSNAIELSFLPAVWTTDPGSHLLEGPALSPDGKHVFFTDLWPGKVYSIELGNSIVTPKLVHSFSPYRCNGLQFLSQTKIAVCVWKRHPRKFMKREGEILELDLNNASNEPVKLVSGLSWPNDLSVDKIGGVYFTDMTAGCVYYLPPGSTSARVVLNKLSTPNGLEIQIDSNVAKFLFVAESGNDRVLRYVIRSPGTVEKVPLEYRFPKNTRVDGLALNSNGILLVAEKTAVYALDSASLKYLGCEPLMKSRRRVPSNICFVDDRSFVVTSYRSLLWRKADLFFGKIN